MPPSRRRLLRSSGVAAAVGLAGCLAVGYAGNERPTPTRCPDEPRVPEPEPHPDGEAIPPVPAPPESLADREAVTEYVETYELAYRWREATRKFRSPLVSVSLDAGSTVREARAGSAVVDVRGMVHGRVDFEHDDADSPGHFDGGRSAASYLVTREAVWRAQAGRDGDTSGLDPREDGVLLECYRQRGRGTGRKSQVRWR